VLLLVLGFDAGLTIVRLLRGLERVEPTSDSSSSVVSGADLDFSFVIRRSGGPRCSAMRAYSSYMDSNIRVNSNLYII
jgi:hypothetical protein